MELLIGTWIAALLTLAIFSFLYRDNPFYKAAEHLYVGISAGYWPLYIWFFDVKPMLVEKFQTGTGFERWSLLLPATFSLLMLSRFFPAIAHWSRVSIAFTVGIGAGLGLTGAIQGFILPQIQSTIVALDSINNVILVVGVFCTTIYFYFSKPHTGALGHIAKVGIVFIMISFGASFGYTFMGRVSLLIGRIWFLIHDWLHVI